MTREEAKREILFAKREVMADSWIDKAYDMAIEALEQPEQRWIPCTPDTMPDEAGEYLCTLVGVHNQGLPVECGYEPHNQKGMITGWSTCEADGFKLLRDEEVIAWMPLPEPYGGEQE